MGRQPWVVFGEMLTARRRLPQRLAGEVLTSFVAFTLLYGALAVVEVRLLLRYARAGLPDVAAATDAEPDEDRAPLAFAY